MNERTRDDLKSLLNSFRTGNLQTLSADARGCAPNACIVYVQNTSGWSINRFGVVFLGEAMIAPEDNPNEFMASPKFNIAADDEKDIYSWGIALEPIARGSIGRVCVSGVTIAAVLLDEENPDDEYCDVDTRYLYMNRLVSGFVGSTKILYRSDVKNTGFWGDETRESLCIVRLGDTPTRKIQVELLEDLHTRALMSRDKKSNPSYEVGSAKAKYIREESGYSAMVLRTTEREITVHAPLTMASGDRILKESLVTATWFPRDRRWVVDMPPRAEFYGIPPENENGYPAGSVFIGNGNSYDWNQWDAWKIQAPVPKVVELSITPDAGHSYGNTSLIVPWVIQKSVPAGSRTPVEIRRLTDPGSVPILTTPYSSITTVQPGYRYSLEAGKTILTTSGNRPVWYCHERGHVVYDRYLTTECLVRELVSRYDNRQTVRVTIGGGGDQPVWSYQQFDCTATFGTSFGSGPYGPALVPDIYSGDVIIAKIDLESNYYGDDRSRIQSEVLRFPLDERRGNIKMSDVEPGRGWVNVSGEYYNGNNVYGYVLCPSAGNPATQGSGFFGYTGESTLSGSQIIASTGKAIKFWRKTYPEDNP